MHTIHHGPPTRPNGRPEYFTSQVGAFALTNSRETFVQGASAYRNLREWATEVRNDAIKLANARLNSQPEDHEPTISEGDEYLSPSQLPAKRGANSSKSADKQRKRHQSVQGDSGRLADDNETISGATSSRGQPSWSFVNDEFRCDHNSTVITQATMPGDV